jgi:hypothetical protein
MTNSPSNAAIKEWSWSTHDYVNYGYVKDSFAGNSYGYLKHNSSNQYELGDDVGTLLLGYICEAQGKF